MLEFFYQLTLPLVRGVSDSKDQDIYSPHCSETAWNAQNHAQIESVNYPQVQRLHNAKWRMILSITNLENSDIVRRFPSVNNFRDDESSLITHPNACKNNIPFVSDHGFEVFATIFFAGLPLKRTPMFKKTLGLGCQAGSPTSFGRGVLHEHHPTPPPPPKKKKKRHYCANRWPSDSQREQ